MFVLLDLPSMNCQISPFNIPINGQAIRHRMLQHCANNISVL